MNNLLAHKSDFIYKKAQIIVLSEAGILVDSCHALMDLSAYQNQYVFDQFAFLESIESTLLALQVEDGELYFPRVEIQYGGKDWVFDFTFFRPADQPTNLVWMIEDLSKQYNYLLKVQQERNQSIIRQQLRDARNRYTNLKKEVEFLNKVQRIKLEFLSKVTHNISVPIEEIRGIIYLLNQYVEEKEGKVYLESLNQTTERFQVMLQDLLEFSTLDAGKITFETKQFTLSESMWSVIRAFDYASMKKDIPILLHTHAGVPQQVRGDDVRLSQILYNLINYVLSQTEKGKISIDVKAQTQVHDYCTLAFIFRANSPKIKKEEVDYLLEMYTQLPTERTPTNNAALSLSIVKQLIELQGGQIRVSDLAEGGISFEFTLPFSIVRS